MREANHVRVGQLGFTIIELLVTVVIVSILASVVLPMAELSLQRKKEQQLHEALMQIRRAIDAYKQSWDEGRIERKMSESGYPHHLDELVDGVPDIKSPQHAKLYFLRRVPRDPFYPDQSVPASKTWGLRSYASSADDPKPGNDVFDVYSLSPGMALDQTPYRQW
jgi:general secretion pathway protein G